MPAFLVMNAGANAGARFELSPVEKNLLGRDWQCKIVLNDPQCSRVHADVFFDEDGWWLRDNKSSNGTFVNGQAVDEARLLEGTEVRIGACVFSFSEASSQKTKPVEEEVPGNKTTGNLTVVLDKSLNPKETGQYTLDFLKGHNWGQDFFFLFQLSVKLLSIDEPESVVEVCMSRLAERTEASAAGFMWLSEEGKLTPKMVFPQDRADNLKLDPDLTRRVVEQKHAIRVEHDSTEGKKDVADSICVPLIDGGEVKGAIHLYRDSKPFHNAHFQVACAMANIMVRSLARANRLTSLAAEHSRLVEKTATFDEMKGESPAMLDLKSKITRVAQASGCVLIRGESGAGKELVAQGIHRESDRRSSPMVPVNCASIPESLMESELFGHVKGAFTGADKDKKGLFEIAEGGTLFLDEIGDIPVSLQPKLLRVLQESEIRPVGGGQSRAVDIRVIAATSKDLEKEMASGHFREDLFYRLNVVPITLPPLRHRPEDIPLLCKFFINRFNKSLGSSIMNISSAAMTGLMQHDWPGNIRELENAIERAIVLADGSTLELENFVFGKGGASNPDPTGSGYDGFSLKAAKAELEDKMIRKALTATGGNRTHAANMLEISHPSLLSKIKLYGIEK